MFLSSSSTLHQDHDEFTRQAEEERKRMNDKSRRDDEDDQLRRSLLTASLTFVPAYGWTSKAVKAAVRDLGRPETLAGLAGGNPGVSLVHHHLEESEEKLEEELRSWSHKTEDFDILRTGIETRLRMNVPLITRWSEALALMSMPDNVQNSLQLDLSLVDTLWHYAGDEAVNLDWYAKRLALLAVYKATELAMIQDQSEDFAETWAFLDRRFDEQAELRRLWDGAGDFKSVLGGVAATLQNMADVRKK